MIVGRMSRDASSPLKAYIHQHAWLQYASVALTAAAALYSEHRQSVDAQQRDSATTLYETNIQTTINYFTQRSAADRPQPGLSLLSNVSLFVVYWLKNQIPVPYQQHRQAPTDNNKRAHCTQSAKPKPSCMAGFGFVHVYCHQSVLSSALAMALVFFSY